MKRLSVKKIIKSVSLIFVCILCVLSVTYAWYSMINYEGKGIKYSKNLRLSSRSGSVTNYVGTGIAEDNQIIYAEIGEIPFEFDYKNNTTIELDASSLNSFVSKNLFPGSKIYFKTTVQNDEELPIYTAIYLNEISYDVELNPAIKVTQVQPASYNTYFYKHSKCIEDNCLINGVQISSNFEVKKGESQDIYWYIEIMGDKADNSCMNAEMSINAMYLSTGE